MNVLLADKVPDWFHERLKELGCQVHLDPSLGGESLTQAIKDHNPKIMVVRSTKVQREQLDAGELALVIRAGAGVNTIDIAYARERACGVANCPGKNASAVAELAIGHLINMDRRIADGVNDLRQGRWAKKAYAKSAGLRGSTLGLMGMGNIGRETATIALAMGMKVVMWDPFVDAETAKKIGVEKIEDKLELAKSSDAVSIHVALVPPTVGLIDHEFCQAMKPGAYFINTSRAGIVVKEALAAAIKDKGVRAGLDVFWDEPGASDKDFADDIVKLDGVYGTHHIGASTAQAQDAVAKETLRVVETFLSSQQIINCVN